MHNRMTWSEQGKMITRKVPLEKIEHINELTGNYRSYRKHRRELAKLQIQIIETIAQVEAATNEQTRKPLTFLDRAPKTVPNAGSTRRKTSRN